jgi:hypothetical protein
LLTHRIPLRVWAGASLERSPDVSLPSLRHVPAADTSLIHAKDNEPTDICPAVIDPAVIDLVVISRATPAAACAAGRFRFPATEATSHLRSCVIKFILNAPNCNRTAPQ